MQNSPSFSLASSRELNFRALWFTTWWQVRKAELLWKLFQPCHISSLMPNITHNFGEDGTRKAWSWSGCKCQLSCPPDPEAISFRISFVENLLELLTHLEVEALLAYSRVIFKLTVRGDLVWATRRERSHIYKVSEKKSSNYCSRQDSLSLWLC